MPVIVYLQCPTALISVIFVRLAAAQVDIVEKSAGTAARILVLSLAVSVVSMARRVIALPTLWRSAAPVVVLGFLHRVRC